MPLYAAFLRGMNVGGHRITNAELRARFAEMGLEDPRCFRASGNVVFGAPVEQAATLAARIEGELRSWLGYAVPVFLRTRQQVLAIAALEPFSRAALAASAGRAQVAMLASPPSAGARSSLAELAGEREQVIFRPLELHWLPSGGVLDSALDMASIEAALGPITMRTARTVSEIAARHLAG